MESPADDNLIEIHLPASAAYAQTLRVLTASVGADIGLTVDEIDDLRLAIDEVFNSASAAASRVKIGIRPDGNHVSLQITSNGTDIILDELARSILTSVVEMVELGGTSVSFTKTAAEQHA